LSQLPHSLYEGTEDGVGWRKNGKGKIMEIKKCKYSGCGKVLEQKPHEHPAVFKKRVYCDVKCAIAGQREAKHWRIDGWLSTPK